MEFVDFVKEQLLQLDLDHAPDACFEGMPALHLALYGPALAGKTTLLRYLHGVWQQPRSKLLSFPPRTAGLSSASSDDDWAEAGLIASFDGALRLESGDRRVRVAGTGGHVWRDAARQELVRWADTILFVADAQVEREMANEEMWDNLQEQLAQLRPERPPPVQVALNKVDLAGTVATLSVDDLRSCLRLPADQPVIETCAATGRDVLIAVKAAIRAGLRAGTDLPR
jgi:hypothetical protein